ncbi:MAG: N(4)-(beta-N-acetylglucosaminyl)-L-asparaginase [Calditrichia bacterium]
MNKLKRREFLKSTVLAGTGLSLFQGIFPFAKVEAKNSKTNSTALPEHPVVVASANGERAVARAMEMLKGGADPLDAVIAGVNIVEDDPDDITVGYGGLPNEAGVVQLDASVMHGPTHNAGAVACLEGVKNPSKVAKLVMELTDYVLLVGKGAQDFARAHGFPIQDLLTEKARKIWLYWKSTLSDKDDWFPPPPHELGEEVKQYFRLTGTINCLAVNTQGDMGGVTTTSGLPFKIPGRVGDSPIIGAGLYLDNEVGAAGSTGRGEANLKNLSCFMIVEFMRQGKSPTEACLAMCQRIADHTRLPYLLKEPNTPNFNVNFYAINKQGEFGGASIYSDHFMWVFSAEGKKLIELPYLFKK